MLPGFAALSADDFDLDGNIKVWSAMVNGLVDFGNEDGLSFYVGAGAGRAKAKAFGDSDSAWAFQGIVGARYAVSRNIDLGLKYRYFQTGKLNFSEDPIAVNGNGDAVIVGTTPVVTTTNAVLFPDFEQKFRSHSLLASLIFNFGGGEEAAPAAPAAGSDGSPAAAAARDPDVPGWLGDSGDGHVPAAAAAAAAGPDARAWLSVALALRASPETKAKVSAGHPQGWPAVSCCAIVSASCAVRAGNCRRRDR